MVKKNSIPERWRSLTSVGQRVPGSRFIAFKVPLKGTTNQRVTQNQKFTPKDLVSNIRAQNEELGIIIDLTNTERYYTTKDLPRSVQYVKLHTAGLKIPDDATIHQFKRVVRRFLAGSSDNDKLIGVHCTTGINRTGYLICRYLIDVDGWKPLYAISAFAQSRGHPIEGTVYIEDLVKGPVRSNVGIDLPPTDEELNNGLDDVARDRVGKDDRLRSILELMQGNEFGDFDAREQRPLPLIRSRSGELQEDLRDFFNSRPEFRDGRFPDMTDDCDLRVPFGNWDSRFSDNDHMNPDERFRRHGDFPQDGRFNPELENRRNFFGNEPRPLMDGPDNYGPRGMQDMFFDNAESRGQQSPRFGFQRPFDNNSSRPLPPFARGKMENAQFEEMEDEHRMHPLSNDLPFRERLRQQEGHSMENEDPRFHQRDPRSGPLRGPINDRMHPRDPRAMEGPMNERMHPRDAQFMDEPMSEMMHPRDMRDMEGPMNKRMHPRNARFMEGAMNERMHQRDEPFMEGPMNDRMNPRDMEGPGNERFAQRDTRAMNERMHPRDMGAMGRQMNENAQARDAQFMEGPMNERMHQRVSRLMELPLNERMNPRDLQSVEGPMTDRMPRGGGHAMNRPMNERLHQRDSRAMDGPMNDQMHQRDARNMEGPMNERMHQRDARSMEGPMNERMHPRNARGMEGPMNEMFPRDARAMEGPMNERMHPRNALGMENAMNEPMHPRNGGPMEGPMNEWRHPRDGPINERMHPHRPEFPMNKPRPMDGPMHGDFMNDARPFDGRKNNPSDEMPRGPNRFAPYPSHMKPMQGPDMLRGPSRGGFGMREDEARFPPRNRFN